MSELSVIVSDVFAEDGSVKPCGREKCKRLIDTLYSIFPDKKIGFFGDSKTGIMNVETCYSYALKKLGTKNQSLTESEGR